MLEKLWTINDGLSRRFPAGNDPFQIVARLLEECGELAGEINHFEGAGVKREKHGEPVKAQLAKEVQDVLRSTLQVAQYYDVKQELAASIERSYQRLVIEGFIEEDAAMQVPAKMMEATLCFLVKGQPPSEILLGLKKAGFGADKYNGFGGKLQDGETVERAAVRELEEEASIRVMEKALQKVAHLTFFFPFKPEWDQIVHVFLAKSWEGEPVESIEMKPAWFRTDEIPFEQMWQDDAHWLPLVLKDKRVRASFTFKDDNESIETVDIKEW